MTLENKIEWKKVHLFALVLLAGSLGFLAVAALMGEAGELSPFGGPLLLMTAGLIMWVGSTWQRLGELMELADRQWISDSRTAREKAGTVDSSAGEVKDQYEREARRFWEEVEVRERELKTAFGQLRFQSAVVEVPARERTLKNFPAPERGSVSDGESTSRALTGAGN